jgi:PIN domain nuclease of toxin-antitoxin system
LNLLVDTHALLWFCAGDPQLSSDARRAIEVPDTTNYVSMASWWEIAIKCSLGKLRIDDPLEGFIARRADEGFRVLPIETQHLTKLTDLPFHHRDPFDRLLVSQAIHENMPICTSDRHFRSYDVRVVW